MIAIAQIKKTRTDKIKIKVFILAPVLNFVYQFIVWRSLNLIIILLRKLGRDQYLLTFNLPMLITADLCIPFPRSLVYTAYRDKLVELVPYMPNVRSVEVKSRCEDNERIYCVNLWHGGGKIPLAIRAIIGEAMLSWTEYDIWNESNFTLEWRIETHSFTEAVSCAGKNRFLENNGSTIIETRGELRMDPEQLEGLTQSLRGKIASIVENFLVKKIVPNLIQMSEGVDNYLKQTATN